MRVRVWCLLLALLPMAAVAEGDSLGLSYVETKDLKLIYFDSLDYLVPHAVRTFTNSVAWQRRTFDWVPSEPTIVMLKDFSDYGGATAAAAPRSRIFIEISPISHAFETFPASERMYSIMNHEMVHVVQGDISSE